MNQPAGPSAPFPAPPDCELRLQPPLGPTAPSQPVWKTLLTRRIRRGRWPGVIMGLVVLVTSVVLTATPASQGDVRVGVRQDAFKSGGERSEKVLREILQTLQRIDARLARLEKKASGPTAAQPNGQ